MIVKNASVSYGLQYNLQAFKDFNETWWEIDTVLCNPLLMLLVPAPDSTNTKMRKFETMKDVSSREEGHTLEGNRR